MKKQIKNLLAIFLLCTFLVVGGLSCGGSDQPPAKVTLNYWRAWDDDAAIKPLIAAYQAARPYVHINYRKLRYEEYEQALLEGWADNAGPDIFSIQNTWVNKYQARLLPIPKQIQVYFMTSTQSLGKTQLTVTKKPITPLTTDKLAKDFIDVVPSDVVLGGQIYGLPLYVDNLALFYNKKLLANAQILTPPTTWDEFQEDVKKLTLVDDKGKFIQSGVALGTANNVPRSFDILSMLMMQNGTTMIGAGGASFNQPLPTDRTYLPGVSALQFYTDFANPGKKVYSWNNDMPDALESFMAGKVAFFFGYAYQVPVILAQAPKLDFDIAYLPQIPQNNKVTYANYWVETVWKRTKYPNEAWDFLQFITANSDRAKTYLDKTGRPAALKSLLPKQAESTRLEVFANQNPYAKSWYHGKDAIVAENIFKDMINQALLGELTYQQVINNAVARINQTLQ